MKDYSKIDNYDDLDYSKKTKNIKSSNIKNEKGAFAKKDSYKRRKKKS